jgi:transketolase
MDSLAAEVRIDALKMITKAKSSHIGSCFSCVEILLALYAGEMHYDPEYPKWSARDRFILSKGHAAAAYYSVLAKAGFFPDKELTDFCKHMSTFTSHVNEEVPGVEVSTGSLGHGLSVGLGMALAIKEPKVYVLMSDGEMNEGSVWEAIMLAGHLRVENLVVIIDNNRLQACGSTVGTLDLYPLDKKLEQFGWATTTCDGHNGKVLRGALIKSAGNKPHAIIANTTKGKGVSFMENELEWHYKIPTEEELAAAIKELEDAKSADKSFSFPGRVR